MFRLAKYYILLNLYRRVKRNIFTVLISMLMIFVVSFIFSDLRKIIVGEGTYIIIAVKWTILLSLGVLMVLNLFRIVKAVSVPFGKDDNQCIDDPQKEKILTKENLLSRSDQVIYKYRNQE